MKQKDAVSLLEARLNFYALYKRHQQAQLSTLYRFAEMIGRKKVFRSLITFSRQIMLCWDEL
jgi:hypothetical protein